MLDGRQAVILSMQEASTLLDWFETHRNVDSLRVMESMGVLPVVEQLRSIVREWREREV